MNETFRMKRSIRNEMLTCLAFFIAIDIASVCGFLLDPKCPHPLIAALVVGAFWSCFIIGCLLALLAYWKYRLIIEDDHIIKVGIFTTRELRLGDVTEARWRLRPTGGGVMLVTPDVRMKIHFNEYTTEQRDALVRHLRAELGPAVHTGWTLFAYLITSGETKERVPQEGDVVVDRRRWDRLFLGMLPLFAATGAYLAWQADRWAFLFVPFVPLAFLWLLIRFATPAKGLTRQPLSKEERAPGQLKMLAVLVACLPLTVFIQRFPVAEPARNAINGIVFVPLLIGFLVWGHKADRWKQRRNLQAAEAAAFARGENRASGS